MTRQKFIEEMEQLYGKDTYDYSEVPETFPKQSKVTITCNRHHITMTQYAKFFIYRDVNECPECKIEKGYDDKRLTGFLPFDETYNHRFLGKPIDRSDITKRMLKAIKSFELGTGNPRADKKELQRWMKVRDKSKKLETDR